MFIGIWDVSPNGEATLVQFPGEASGAALADIATISVRRQAVMLAETLDVPPEEIEVTVFPVEACGAVESDGDDVDVESEADVSLVVFRIDGREIARFSEPPYQARTAVGDDNVEHRFEVVVRDGDTELARVVRETPTLRVDDELELELRQLYVTVEDGDRRADVVDIARVQPNASP